MKSVFLTYIFEQMQMKRYAKRTIESYLYWIKPPVSGLLSPQLI
jgi:hypothetical protein